MLRARQMSVTKDRRTPLAGSTRHLCGSGSPIRADRIRRQLDHLEQKEQRRATECWTCSAVTGGNVRPSDGGEASAVKPTAMVTDLLRRGQTCDEQRTDLEDLDDPNSRR